ncbi:hypothetical protein ACG04Q_04150 [Roseateles sp. DXS20W]|uniref:Type III secretion system protein n=1 Tax=Pelomonas lactea TaxID=3299030 RepID=A0ABW7GFM3_9BURK
MSSIPQAFARATHWQFTSGPAHLAIRADDVAPGELPPCAAEAAVVLDLAGELLDALAAAGLVVDAPWQWLDVDRVESPGVAQARWHGLAAEARLALPWPALRALPTAPDVPGLLWEPVPAECVLAQWSLGDDDLAALEPGGLLLLEAPAAQRLRARAEVAGADELPWQLVARWEQPLALETVLGWGAPAPFAPVACQLIHTAQPDVVRARGRLLPWGTGHAMRIDSV